MLYTGIQTRSSRMRRLFAHATIAVSALAILYQGIALPPPASAAMPTVEQLQATAKESLAAMSEFKDDNFTMSYPSSWEKETTNLPPFQILRAKALHGAVNLIVVADKSPAAATIESFADSNVAALKAAFGDKLTFVTDEPIDLKNTKGRLLVMSQTMKEEGKEPLKFRQYMVLFVSNGTGYGLTCTTVDSWYPQFETVFQAMAKSVAVTPTKAKTEAKSE